MNKTAILFDLDGTLIDSTNAILSGFYTAFDEFKFLRPKKDEICSLIGHPLEFMFENLGIPKELIENFIKVYKEAYRKIYLQDTTLLQYANEALNTANSFADLGVVTTKTSKYSFYLLEHLGVARYFKTIVGRDDVIKPKPDPEPILKALENLNGHYNNIYMIGDTVMDAKAAKAANIVSIGVTCGYGIEQNLIKSCDFISLNSKDSVKLIVSLNNNFKIK